MRYIESAHVKDYIGHEAITDPAPVVHMDIPVDVDDERSGGSIDVHISVADVENPIGIGIMGASWSDYGKRPFQTWRLGSIARFSGMRMLGVDFPGMGDSIHGRSNEFTTNDVQEMKEGRFRSMAVRTWDALKDTVLLQHADHNLPLALLGHSLSTLFMAEMADTLPEGHVIQDFHSSETMALIVRSKPTLVSSFIYPGGLYLGKYAKMNGTRPATVTDDEPRHGMGRQVFEQPEAHLRAFSALGKGMHGEIIESAVRSGRLSTDKEHGTRHHLVAAERGIAPTPAMKEFEQKLLKQGYPSSQLFYRMLSGEFHGWQDSFPALLADLSSLAILESTR